ncbi:MAG TPA: hypothetical protein VGR00_04765 [Thermoanaerobaculia bacterium]|nr:hypothetical protein [Thermoanaerobaculia bacterium]
MKARTCAGLAVATCMLVSAAARGVAAEKEHDLRVATDWSPDNPGGEGAVWLAYLMDRADYVWKHRADYPQRVGPISASFEEEVEARTIAAKVYGELRAQDSGLDVPYFDDLAAVHAAGFMREYVWEYLRAPSWKPPATLKLEAFKAWRSAHLANHRVVTKGGLRFEKPAR